jgi:hypothetical protein
LAEAREATQEVGGSAASVPVIVVVRFERGCVAVDEMAR